MSDLPSVSEQRLERALADGPHLGPHVFPCPGLDEGCLRDLSGLEIGLKIKGKWAILHFYTFGRASGGGREGETRIRDLGLGGRQLGRQGPTHREIKNAPPGRATATSRERATAARAPRKRETSRYRPPEHLRALRRTCAA